MFYKPLLFLKNVPGLLLQYLPIASNVLIWLAFLAVAIKTFYYIRTKQGSPFPPSLSVNLYILLFVSGISQLLNGLQFWYPAYALHPIIQLLLALFSWAVFFYFLKTIPDINDVKTPEELEHEINDRIDIEDKLIAKNKQLEWAEKTAKICYGNWDIAHDTIIFSDGAKEVLGLKSGKVFNFEKLISLIIPQDRALIEQFAQAVMDSKTLEPFQFRTVVGGKLKYIQVNGEVATDETNNVYRLRGTFQDVTRQQMFIKRIEVRNEALKEIAWIQSHDVRGPLATILGLVSILDENSFKDEESKIIISGLKDASTQLDKVIRAIVERTISNDIEQG